MQKPQRHAALDTLDRTPQIPWHHAYRENGLRWEKFDPVHSLRITPLRRALAFREGACMRLLTVAPDYDSTFGHQ